MSCQEKALRYLRALGGEASNEAIRNLALKHDPTSTLARTRGHIAKIMRQLEKFGIVQYAGKDGQSDVYKIVK